MTETCAISEDLVSDFMKRSLPAVHSICLTPVLWIRIGFKAIPDPDPDPAFYLNANPDPDPVSQSNADPCESGSGSRLNFQVTIS